MGQNRRFDDTMQDLYDLLLRDSLPDSVLIDSSYQILRRFPGSEAYLRPDDGRLKGSVLDLVDSTIRSHLADAIQRAINTRSSVRTCRLAHPKSVSQSLCLVVRPYRPGDRDQVYLLVQFDLVAGEPDAGRAATSGEFHENNDASSRMQTYGSDPSNRQPKLRAMVNEFETSNRELKARNQEIFASNQDLQKANEQLQTVNEEYLKRAAELDEVNSDMNHLLATTQVGVIFLDGDLSIRRFTPAVGQMLLVQQRDIGRGIGEFLAHIDDHQFLDKLKEVFKTQVEREWDIVCSGSAFLTRATPYRKGAEVTGVVVSFVNVDSIKRTEADLARFKFMADQNVDAQVLVDENAKVVYSNEQMAKGRGYELGEMQSLDVMCFDCEHDMAKFRERFDDARQHGGGIFESTHVHKEGTRFPVEIAVTFVEFNGKPFLFSTIRDITSRKDAERKRRLLEKAIESVESGIVISDPAKEGNPLTFVNAGFCNMTGYEQHEVLGRNCRFLQGSETDPQVVEKLRNGIVNAEPTRVLIRNHRKDNQPFWNDLFITPVTDATGETIAFVGVQNDATERVEANRELRNRERTIRLLLDSTAEGIFGLDVDGRCMFINRSALKLLGYHSPDDLIGRVMHDVIQQKHADDSEYSIVDSVIMRTLRTGEPETSADEVFWRGDNTKFPVEYWSHPLVEDGECTGIVVTFVDMTTRTEELEELREARETADAANAAKSRFLANMSHELRTPLSAILGFTEIMKDEAADPDTLERLSTIIRNGEYLLRLLNDVLDLSRIEAGKLRTSFDLANLQDLLVDVNQTMQMRAVDNQSTLRFHLNNPLPLTVTTDAARVRQVMINLIGNAIKFSPQGRVEVNVLLNDDVGRDRKILDIEVRDNGIGISESQLESLFQPFQQAERTITERFGGTGLGLSISNRLTEALGGTISAESREGEGSCFKLRLPIEPMGPLQHLSIDQTSETDAAKSDTLAQVGKNAPLSAHVLIADDMRDVRFVTSHYLKQLGCDVTVVENGRKAIEQVEKAVGRGTPFDLVLMDVQMPEMDGEEAVKELRRLGILVPVIALTADAMKGTRQRLLSAGFDEYLTKPLDRSRLVSIVKEVLGRD